MDMYNKYAGDLEEWQKQAKEWRNRATGSRRTIGLWRANW